MRAHHGTGSIAAAALCLTLVASGAAAPARADARPTAIDSPSLEVRELTGPDIPLDDLAPGDTVDWAADVTNVSGDSSPLSVRLDAMRSMALTGDALGGIQLSVRLCEAGFETLTAPMRCRGPVEPLGSGPAATLDSVVTRTPLRAGETVGVAVQVRFPSGADNGMESTAGMVRIGFALVDDGGTGTDPSTGGGTGGGTGNGSGSGTGTGSVTSPAGSAPAADAPRDLLPVTGRDIASALAGALLALLGGGILLLAGRRRRRTAEAAS
ncbi:sortase [Clavibacter sp. VKM Ac-2542]|uniref:sortase n=1 Tax=Clavibacter TaxID=1573 RepID=UPI00188C3E9A|nr:sortase [Clavibacter sp. VKM Ac-2542]MBF4621475.1 sortase [Clavibacter sp. VKM Ac-2542]